MRQSHLLTVIFFSLVTISPIQAQTTSQTPVTTPTPTADRVVTDPAPSGVERSERFTDARTGRSITMPGKDAPVHSKKQGRTEKLDFDSRDQPSAERDTTIHVIVPKK